ncbi:IS66 family insertion sequence element accessory protein TnpB [Paenibacillus oceani]|uniref:IS66 family insertion sequence element accessory protein TnpB n=1 Tax=Paenibacillus oceani TaxID=2772510 RepID=A0A927GZ66_9BACL|nr:IS66 family insertion sequence element accessory protein TnpB [Paenibacillus oceani]MBD2862666.1 IS66 family insertion sequence element accessory protein TnpB [Paenibacillus oceani]
MLTLPNPQHVYLTCGPTDLRKSIDALAALVQEGFGLDPFAPSLFVFCNRQRDKLKMLLWDHNGFWLLYRRLERGTFQWPTGGEGTVTVSSRELRWLDGLALEQCKAHPPVRAEAVM